MLLDTTNSQAALLPEDDASRYESFTLDTGVFMLKLLKLLSLSDCHTLSILGAFATVLLFSGRSSGEGRVKNS